MTYIADKKEIEIKGAVQIFSSLNGPQTLLVSKVLKIFKLIWLAPATNAVSERLCSTLYRVKAYLLQSIFQDYL